jgi:uncharacterized protein YebE (UPF0316 family)
MQVDMYAMVIIPLLIFFARVCDVSLGTIRIIFISKGIRYLAPIVGFFEILIWILAISQIFQNITNSYYYIFYAGGFACGTFVGIMIDEKLSIGTVAMRIITRKDAKGLIEALQTKNFGLTVVDAESSKGKVKLIFSVIKRNQVKEVIALLRKYNPKSFYSIEDIRFVSENLTPLKSSRSNNLFYNGFLSRRKGK